ncbi:MAG: SRPBCC family protein [Alphaproteobacteria bacterium]|nr:SRPBCC family protein [Alphaproteobacteria bacterium]
MATFEIVTWIDAPQAACFDLARDIGFHVETLAGTGERAVAGRTDGLIGLGETVTFEGVHFGVRQRLTSKITAFDRPHHFRDEQVQGAFARFRHDHVFETVDGRTRMRDTLDFASPLGPLGWVVDRVVMTGHLRRLLAARCEDLRVEAERRHRAPR